MLLFPRPNPSIKVSTMHCTTDTRHDTTRSLSFPGWPSKATLRMSCTARSTQKVHQPCMGSTLFSLASHRHGTARGGVDIHTYVRHCVGPPTTTTRFRRTTSNTTHALTTGPGESVTYFFLRERICYLLGTWEPCNLAKQRGPTRFTSVIISDVRSRKHKCRPMIGESTS